MLQDHAKEVASVADVSVLLSRSVLDDAGYLLDLSNSLQNEEPGLTALFELLKILSDATLHCCHELVEVASAICDDDLGSLDNLHRVLVRLLQLSGWDKEDAILVTIWVRLNDWAFEVLVSFWTELHLRLEVVDVLWRLTSIAHYI